MKYIFRYLCYIVLLATSRNSMLPNSVAFSLDKTWSYFSLVGEEEGSERYPTWETENKNPKAREETERKDREAEEKINGIYTYLRLFAIQQFFPTTYSILYFKKQLQQWTLMSLIPVSLVNTGIRSRSLLNHLEFICILILSVGQTEPINLLGKEICMYANNTFCQSSLLYPNM